MRTLFQRPWWTSARILGVTACVAGFGLSVWPRSYDNPSYRVLLAHVTARQAGFAWLAIGIVSIVAANRYSIALLGSALIAWGLGFGAAALTDAEPAPAHVVGHGSGSPLGWVWYIGFGAAVLRTLAVDGARRMRS